MRCISGSEKCLRWKRCLPPTAVRDWYGQLSAPQCISPRPAAAAATAKHAHFKVRTSKDILHRPQSPFFHAFHHKCWMCPTKLSKQDTYMIIVIFTPFGTFSSQLLWTFSLSAVKKWSAHLSHEMALARCQYFDSSITNSCQRAVPLWTLGFWITVALSCVQETHCAGAAQRDYAFMMFSYSDVKVCFAPWQIDQWLNVR